MHFFGLESSPSPFGLESISDSFVIFTGLFATERVKDHPNLVSSVIDSNS